MTRQTVEDLHDKAQRLNDEIVEAMQERDGEGDLCSWGVEYEIPAETNGWTYYGDMGAPATCAYWCDEWNDITEAVSVMIHSTHPRNSSRDVAKVTHTSDIENKIDSKRVIDEFEGNCGRTPLYVRRQIFWEAVERAIEWMENNPPTEGN